MKRAAQHQAPAVDPRDVAISENLSKHKQGIPAGVIADLKHFAMRYAQGRAISYRGMSEYINRANDVKLGRRKLHSLAIENGIVPWWSTT
jgi:hypothetical protein